jgi:NDP-sugar pyrophosphorylase family protein
MIKQTKLTELEVLILCGGLGTRLRSMFPDIPKGLATIGNKTFLDIQVDELLDIGFQRFIFCVGHLKNKIIERFQTREGGDFLFSEEEKPLGTGGAVKNAESLIKGDRFFILNGDSLCHLDFREFYQNHLSQEAFLSIVLSQALNVEDYGNVIIDNSGKIQSFQEKIKKKGEGLINGGIYLIEREALSMMPSNFPFSLEHDVFPHLLNQKKCSGFVVKSDVLDIGTPERYQNINQLMEKGEL